MHGNQQVFGLPSSSFGQSRSLSLSATRTAKRGASAIARVDFNFKARDFSGSVGTRASGNNGEMAYVKGGMNVKPIVVESVDNVEEESRLEVGEEDENTENLGGVKNADDEAENVEEETEVEKEAWRLLQEALVTIGMIIGGCPYKTKVTFF